MGHDLEEQADCLLAERTIPWPGYFFCFNAEEPADPFFFSTVRDGGRSSELRK